MQEPRFGTDVLSDVRQEGNDIMLSLALDFVDARDFELATFPDSLGGFLRNDAEFGERIACVRLDFEPDAELVLRFPDFCHLGSAVAWDHGLCLPYAALAGGRTSYYLAKPAKRGASWTMSHKCVSISPPHIDWPFASASTRGSATISASL